MAAQSPVCSQRRVHYLACVPRCIALGIAIARLAIRSGENALKSTTRVRKAFQNLVCDVVGAVGAVPVRVSGARQAAFNCGEPVPANTNDLHLSAQRSFPPPTTTIPHKTNFAAGFGDRVVRRAPRYITSCSGDRSNTCSHPIDPAFVQRAFPASISLLAPAPCPAQRRRVKARCWNTFVVKMMC